MNVIETKTQEDASAWTGVVNLQGVVYQASYVNNKLSVGLVAYKHNPRRPRWHEKAVKEWAEKELSKLPLEWFAAHSEMYN